MGFRGGSCVAFHAPERPGVAGLNVWEGGERRALSRRWRARHTHRLRSRRPDRSARKRAKNTRPAPAPEDSSRCPSCPGTRKRVPVRAGGAAGPAGGRKHAERGGRESRVGSPGASGGACRLPNRSACPASPAPASHSTSVVLARVRTACEPGERRRARTHTPPSPQSKTTHPAS